ncbi:unnamed protein product [Penicillium olsonii]|nr:unnamed protein product [Penicillium olsonii]
MVNSFQRLAITRSISSAPCLRKLLVCSRQPVMPASSRNHLFISPPAFREEFFQDTLLRWIFNETDRLNERYVKFRPTELQRIAGEAVQQDYRPYITMLAEGGFNKVFLLRAKNGREVIARIPTPVAGPPHYTTASEVATMDFLRSILKFRYQRSWLIQHHQTIPSEQSIF